MTNFTGTGSDDNLLGTNSDDAFNMVQGGNDTVSALDGNDIISMGARLTALDSLDGGLGADTLQLSGNYKTGVVFSASTMTNIETLTVAAGFNYGLTLNNANVAAGATLTVNSSALVAGDRLVFDGSAETDGTFVFIGGGGNDNLTGGAGNDTFTTAGGNDKVFLNTGGNDTASTGDGNDHFIAAAALTAADQLDGGAGNDQMTLKGNYAGLVFGAATMINVEQLRLRGGFDYNLTTNDATATSTFTVNAQELGAGDTLIFNGSAETGSNFIILAGAGDDTLTVGTGDNKFDLSLGGNDTATGRGGADVFTVGGALTAADTIDGAAGQSDRIIFDGDYSGGLTLGAFTIQNVELFEFTAGHSYTIVGNDNLIHVGQTLRLIANTLGATDSLSFDNSAEGSGGGTTVLAGAGDDTLSTGGSKDLIDITTGGNDTIDAGANDDTILAGNTLTTADSINGGGGIDVLKLFGDYSAGLVLPAQDIERLELGPGIFNLTATQPLVGGGTLTVNNSSGSALIFDGSAVSPGQLIINAGEYLNTISGGRGGDTITGGGTISGNDGADNLIGSALADSLSGGAGSDHLAGGDGNDTLDGGNDADWLTGGNGADRLTGGAGSDSFYIKYAQDSTGVKFDTLVDFTSGVDILHTVNVVSFIAPVDHSVSLASFDSDIAAVAANMHQREAILYTVTSGDQTGREFLIIGGKGDVGYQVGSDYVIYVENGATLTLNDITS